ncbi:MAG TPA: hypothetical protein VFI29_05265 [Hanamia sp.]|nr:hypothetical protein [Hanamia sp.]
MVALAVVVDRLVIVVRRLKNRSFICFRIFLADGFGVTGIKGDKPEGQDRG